MRLHPYFSLLVAFFVIEGVARTELRASDQLLEEAKAGHRAACQLIRSISANVAIDNEYPKRSPGQRGRYLRVGNSARIQQGKEGESTLDYSVNNGETRLVARTKWIGGKPRHFEARRRPATDFVSMCDVWREMMIELAGSDGGQVSYERMLEQSQEFAPSKRVRSEGREYVVVSRKKINSHGLECHVLHWHDVRFNYLISKLEYVYPETKTSGVVRITEFIEPHSGIVFPLVSRREHIVDGALQSARVSVLSNVHINESIPLSELALPTIPNGTILDDTIQGTNGPISADWRPIGPQRKAEGMQLVPGEASTGSPVYNSPSTSEPRSSGWWVIVGSSGALLFLLLYLLVRRVRRSREGSI